jgi:hypothetical protein
MFDKTIVIIDRILYAFVIYKGCEFIDELIKWMEK